MSGIAANLKACVQIFRMEYLPATAPGLFIPFFLCATSVDELFALPVLEGLLAVFLLIFAGLGGNAVADREIDRKYATFKNRIPDAIGVLGVGTVWALIVLQLLAATALTVHIAVQLRSWIPLALLAVELFLGGGYSLRPFHFKVRGVFWHAFSLVLADTFIPFAYVSYIFLRGVPWPQWALILGLSLIHYGWEQCNQAIDCLEDRAEGQRTPAVRLGLRRVLNVALALPLAGLAIEFAALYWLLSSRLADATAILPAWAGGVALLLAGYAMPLRGVWAMRSLARREPPEACVPKMPALCRFARWQASSIFGAAAATAVLFLVTRGAR